MCENETTIVYWHTIFTQYQHCKSGLFDGKITIVLNVYVYISSYIVRDKFVRIYKTLIGTAIVQS